MRFPDKNINFTIFDEGENRVGVATIDLPELSYMTETLSGAGIAGETETPAIGQFGSMETGLTFNSITQNLTGFVSPKAKMIDCRAAMQEYDSGTGELKVVPVRITMNILPKGTPLGSLATAAKTDTTVNAEVTYLKMWVDNVLKVEIDKFNYICIIDGTDYLEEVRSALGLN